MFYHIQGRRSYVGYQRLGRRLYEIVVDGGSPVFARNARALTDDAARIACSLEDADRLPYLLPNPIRASNASEQIRIALRQRDLALYPLPSIDAAQPFSDQSGWGLGFAQGEPLPAACLHQYLHATVVPIDSIEHANVWLGKLAKPVPWTLVLRHTGHLDQMTLNASGDKCRTRLAELLAKGSVHAYQMPCHSGNRGALAEAKPPEEYLPAEGPGNRKATLGPHDQPGYVQKPRATEEPAKTDGKPNAAAPINLELEKRTKELEAIGVKLRTEGFLPTSDEVIQKAIDTEDLGDRRYLVSIQKSKSNTEPVGYRRKDTGRTTMWTSTYDMLKRGDLSAPLLMSLLGSTYDPNSEYTMYIMDQGDDHEQNGALTFTPTWENMREYGPKELHMDNPEDPIYDKELLASVMNLETQQQYKKTMEAFWDDSKQTGRSEYSENEFQEFLEEEGHSAEERRKLRARHIYRTQIGANAYFLGNGATEFTLHSDNKAAINSDGIQIKGSPGKLGTPELLTIEKNPPSIADLEASGAIKAIPLKGKSI